ncbi:MAG: hypothetical protein OJF48_004582 [Afipia sp.]|nr:MAG: hypothetical protein OJF48_004582 [Afipia sp.]
MSRIRRSPSLCSTFRTNVGYERTLRCDSSDPLVLTFVKGVGREMIRMSEPDH